MNRFSNVQGTPPDYGHFITPKGGKPIKQVVISTPRFDGCDELELSNFSSLDANVKNMVSGDFSNAIGGGKAKRKAKKAKRKTNRKKKITSIKNKLGKAGKKFRNNFRKILRKDILSKISKNIHGTAVKLYPAIAPSSELSKKHYRPAYVAKSKKVYSELLSKWIKLGGTETDLKAAIISGRSKRRFLKSPYKHFNGENDSYSFYSYFSSVTGEDEGVESEEEGVDEVPSEEEKTKGIRGFFAWLRSVFSKNDANENPFEVGTADAKDFNDDANEDKGNEPAESEANNDVSKEIADTSSEDDAGGNTDDSKKEGEDTNDDSEDDGKIIGIPKTAFWIGTSVLAATLIGTFVYFKWIKK